MRVILTIAFLFATLMGSAQLMPFPLAVRPTEAPSAPKVAKIDFRSSGTSTGLTNWNTMAGNPHLAVISVSLIDTTGAATGWTCSSVATANWLSTGGVTSNNSVSGITGGTAIPGASAQSYQSIWFNKGTVAPAYYGAAQHQMEITGLDDSKTYDIDGSGSEGQLGFDNRYYVVRAVGANTVGPVEVDGGPGGGGGFTTVGTASSFHLAGIQPTGGKIKFFLNSQSGGTSSSDLAVIANMRIKQN